MRIIQGEGRVVWSASDLKAAAECEFAWCRAIDAKLGRIPAVEDPEDAMLARAAALGDVHEERVLAAYRAELGEEAVRMLPRVSSADEEALQAAVSDTVAALGSEARLVFQAAFATSEFVGFADFLLREDDGRWRVQDSKLARSARATALMQLAAYVDQLDRLGIPRSDEVDLLLGDGQTSTHRVGDILPLFFVRRARLHALIADRRLAEGAAGEPLAWGDDRGDLEIRACGRCATCEEQAIAHRDLLMVARMRPVHRTKLRDAGVTTIDELAAASDAPKGMNPEIFAGLRAQARLQLAALDAPEGAPPPFEAYHPQAIHDLPRPSAGDIFFDFEGDPLHTEQAADARRADWGLDYLFGWVDNDETYTALWAHSFAEEKQALLRFLEVVAEIRRAHPDMHIYHYAPYETAHLSAMAARHGVGEETVDALLREGVFVDLYPLVLRTVRIGDRSYSIKRLEPLYMGDQVRTSDVKKGDDSIGEYIRARALHAAGEEAQAQAILDDLADYNRYDCVSTRRLRNWLIDIARGAGVVPAPPDLPDPSSYEPSPLAIALAAEAEQAEAEGRDGGLYRFAAAAISYYPREAKSFWLAHFQRLREPISMWAQTKDVVHVDPARTTVRRDWSVAEGTRVESRDLEIRGDIAPGTTLGVGAEPFVLYPAPAPFVTGVPARATYVPLSGRRIIEILPDGYVLRETGVDGQTWRDLPLALTPPAPPRALSQQTAIEEWAARLRTASPGFPADAATDILRRIPPRTASGAEIPDGGDAIDAIVRAVQDLDGSYLAVQGPPGTGKTYTGSRVIARLVDDHGYRVGVVAQSHAIVEELLGRVVDEGVPPGQVAKAPKERTGAEKYTVIPKPGMAAFLAEHAGRGAVVGGTAWDFSNTGRVARGELDLLVIDEAGQFSLASTIAVAAGAKRLLLLGDPQQLPQVSQGTHPEPVDTSALGWVMDGEPVLPRTHGYFLSHSQRMHPAVAESVSQLAYAGQLESAAHTAFRVVEGVGPGVHPVPVRHRGNATESPEEAAEVVRIVREVLGRAYTDSAPDGTVLDPRPLGEDDIIVVTPYNAQKQLVQEALAVAGFARVPVGTVDNFQGQEAVVSITSLAASSGRDAARGTEFLLLQNRLNVAISRAKSVAYLVYSPGLLDDLPWTPEGVVRLSAFARLVGAASHTV